MGEGVSNKKMNTSCKQKTEQSKKDGAPENSSDDKSNTDNIDTVSDILGGLDISNNDELLFQDPPPKEDCPICMLPMPHSNICGVNASYYPCCGKMVCSGCMHTAANEIEKGNLKDCCAFCRLPLPSSNEFIVRCKRRMKVNDAEAFHTLAGHYDDGNMGLPKDSKKTIKFWNEAAELGSIRAHYCLAATYKWGEGAKEDTEKALHHYRLAAIGGHEIARHNLGCIEYNNGDVDRAMKHFTIAAKAGFDDSLKMVGIGYRRGDVTKEDYANTLRSYQVSIDEMKSEQRTKAVSRND